MEDGGSRMEDSDLPSSILYPQCHQIRVATDLSAE
jgi:hypothetical protein